jgi:SAM-dependent methyltransferase
MTKKRNPQAEQMADASMVRTLEAQANAIWPQEEKLLDRYGLRAGAHIADVGCGSGEITARLAQHYPRADVVGIDILESSVALARRRYASLAPRVRFEQGDAFELALPSDRFDLAVCRHMSQSVPDPEKVFAELMRIVRPGGWVHVLSEDYSMLHMPVGELDPDRLWHEGAIAYMRNTHTDGRIGRHTWAMMNHLGLEELRVDYAVVDTIRVPRETFAAIVRAWRDGFTDALGSQSNLTRTEARQLFDYAIAAILDPARYSVWHVPIISGRKPAR